MRQAPQAMSVGPLFLTGLALGPAFVRGNVLRELVACPCHMYSASRRGIPPGGVARRSNIPDMLAPRALPGDAP
jgi:hypothetical protein